ncbi:MAG: discoidin domain-containing protein, partial [Alphaproteobacteria bacterium]|nr:discoidin domain-containing protein [Alphaproteobacteria bacterium]
MEDDLPVSYASVSASKALTAGNLSVLNDGVIPAGGSGGDAWNAGKYAAINDDADFIFTFGQVYRFDNVKLDYQNESNASNYGILSIFSSEDGLNWTAFKSGIQTNNGVNQAPLSKIIDLDGLNTKYVKIEMLRAPGNWWGPIMGEISFSAKTGPDIESGVVRIYANASKPYSKFIDAPGSTLFGSNDLPGWLSINSATGEL